ncbi:hypothetical protein PR048_007167 [Dryococelus australis]|uniref:Uncharacterized protein n=1 Tax=Dryococelus australis TaxID=614101 RepID=A0ABQ9ICV6_9NEOP|nr:hypothetical protein PR048_007167 [Dryococelus australis]
MKKRRHGNKSPVPSTQDPKTSQHVDDQLSDDDTNQGFGNWLKSEEGFEYMRLFVIVNSILVIFTMSWSHMSEVFSAIHPRLIIQKCHLRTRVFCKLTMFPLVAGLFRVVFMSGAILWYTVSVWKSMDSYYKDEFKKLIVKYDDKDKLMKFDTENKLHDSKPTIRGESGVDNSKAHVTSEKDSSSSGTIQNNVRPTFAKHELNDVNQGLTTHVAEIPGTHTTCSATENDPNENIWWSKETDEELCTYLTDIEDTQQTCKNPSP